MISVSTNCRIPPAQSLAIGKHHLHALTARRAVLGRSHSHRDLIPSFQGMFGPAALGHIDRIADLGCPMCDFTLVIYCVEPQKTMGIGPQPLRRGGLHDQFFFHIVARRSMMRRQSIGNGQKTNDSEENGGYTMSHKKASDLSFKANLGPTDIVAQSHFCWPA